MTTSKKRVAFITAVILMLTSALGIFAGFGTPRSLAAGDGSSGQYTVRFTVKVLEAPKSWSLANYTIMGQGNNGRDTELEMITDDYDTDFKDKICKEYSDENSAGWFDSGNIDCKDCFPSTIRFEAIFGEKGNQLGKVYTWKAEVTVYINDQKVKNEEVTIEQSSAVTVISSLRNIISFYSISMDDDAFPRIVDLGVPDKTPIEASDVKPEDSRFIPVFCGAVELTPVDQYGVKWDKLSQDDYMLSKAQERKPYEDIKMDWKNFRLEGDGGCRADEDGLVWKITSYEKEDHDGTLYLRYDRGGVEKDDSIEGLSPIPVTVQEEIPLTFQFAGYKEAGEAETAGSIFSDSDSASGSGFGVGSLVVTGGIALVLGGICGALIMYFARRKKVSDKVSDKA